MNNRLSIPEIAGLLAEYTGSDKKSAERFLKEFVLVVRDAAFQDRILKIKGIGTFKVIEVQDRESVDVNTGNRILIPGHYKFSFTPDKELKEEVNKPFSFFETVEISDHVDAAALDMAEEDEAVQPDAPSLTPVIEEPTVEAVPAVEESAPEPVPVEPEEPKEEETPIEAGIPVEDTPEEPAVETESIPVVEEPVIETPEPIAEEDQQPEETEEDMRPGFFIPKVENQSGPETPPAPSTSKGNSKIWIAAVLVIAIGSGAFFFFNRNSLSAWNKSKRDITIVADSIADNLINEMLTASDSLAMDAEEPLPDTGEETPEDTLPASQNTPDDTAGRAGSGSEIITTIEIQPGSRLTLIAQEYYGHKVFWVYLYEYNKNVIKDPNNIPVGTKIAVPVPELYNINTNSKTSLEKATLLQSQILSAL